MRRLDSEAYHEKFMALNKRIPELEAYWREHLPSIPLPDYGQFHQWLHIHQLDVEPLRHAIRAAERRLIRGTKFNDPQHHLQYLSAVALAYMHRAAGVECIHREAA
jgi:hypothetical protein